MQSMVVERATRYKVLALACATSIAPVDPVRKAVVPVEARMQLPLARLEPSARIRTTVQTQSVEVDHLEAAVHAGDEEALWIARVPLEPPDPAACVEFGERDKRFPSVKKADARVVAVWQSGER